MKSKVLLFIVGSLFVHSAQAEPQILSLKNLERERAAMINDLLDPNLSVEERNKQLNKRQGHLTDMERMVMRDERLLKSEASLVKQAFSNYDRTFLVHAGAEKSLDAKEQWLQQVRFTNELIFSTTVTYRK